MVWESYNVEKFQMARSVVSLAELRVTRTRTGRLFLKDDVGSELSNFHRNIPAIKVISSTKVNIKNPLILGTEFVFAMLFREQTQD